MSDLKTFSCPCGATVKAVHDGFAAKAIRSVGWFPAFDIGNGLSLLPLCPPCATRLKAAADEIRAVTKRDPATISLEGL